MGLGIYLEVLPELITIPGDGIVKAISKVSGKKFDTVKVIFDVTLIIIAILLSCLFFHEIRGAGIDTVISALTAGQFVNLFNRIADQAGKSQEQSKAA